jgi:hypothetical protein
VVLSLFSSQADEKTQLLRINIAPLKVHHDGTMTRAKNKHRTAANDSDILALCLVHRPSTGTFEA